MSWLSPVMFAALGTLAVPLLLHLAAARQRDGRVFPSLLFLRQVQMRRERRRRIRDPLLFVLRCLAVVALVAAFAEPISDGPAPAALASTPPLLVLLDRSASMAREGRWAQAQAAARERLAGLAPGQRAALVSFDHELRVEAGFVADRAALLAALAALEPGSAAGRLDGAVEAAERLLRQEAPDGGRLLLVSDLQRANRRPGFGPRLGELTDLEVATLAPVPAPALHLGRVALAPGAAARARLRIELDGSAEVLPAGHSLVLSVDGEALLREAVTATVPGSMVDAEVLRGSDHDVALHLRLEGAAAAAPDWYGVLPARRALRVVLVSDAAAPATVYLQAALALGAAAGVQSEQVASDALNGATLQGADVLIGPRAALSGWTPLADYLRAGGAVLVLADGSTGAASAAWLPGAPAATPVAPPGGRTQLGALRAGHALATRLQPAPEHALSSEPVWRYEQVEASADATVLARYTDGAPALLEAAVGAGRVVQFTTSPDPAWSDLGRDAAFAPLLLETLRHVAGLGEAPLAHRVGEAVDVAALWRLAAPGGAGRVPGALLVSTPDGATVELAGATQVLGLQQAGVYTARDLGGGARLRFAANVPLEELDDDHFTVQAWLARVTRQAEAPAGRAATAGSDEPAARPWSMVLLMLALALFFAEAALGNRLTTRRAARA